MPALLRSPQANIHLENCSMSAKKQAGKRKATVAGQRRFDIRDVALRARVSIATVSRTINGVTTVDKQLAARVWKAVKYLNYYPDTQARGLVSGKSKLFGLLISEITNPFFPELIQGFEEIAVRHGYDVLISSTSHDPARMEVCIRRLLERKVEGVAVMTFGIEAPLLDELAQRSIPMVFVDMTIDNPLSSTLVVDYKSGITQAVKHLTALGHTRIGFVSGPLRQRSAFLRREAFQQALSASGIEPHQEWLIEGDHTLEGGMRAAEHLLTLEHRPSAILCSNDMTAIGALRYLANNKIRVPDEFSVIGFDNIHLAEFVHPALTTIQMSRKDLARAAFEALQSTVEPQISLRPIERSRETSIPTTLVVRQSTAPPPQISSAVSVDERAPSQQTRRSRKAIIARS
jgi:DNA-binding LacI/PurR family transcriptional regulator